MKNLTYLIIILCKDLLSDSGHLLVWELSIIWWLRILESKGNGFAHYHNAMESNRLQEDRNIYFQNFAK